MKQMRKDGITIEVSPEDVDYYLRRGYLLVDAASQKPPKKAETAKAASTGKAK